MNLRKFYLILTVILASSLFIFGIFILSYVGIIDNSIVSNTSGYFGDIVLPFLQEKDSVNVLVLGGDKVAKNTDTIILANYNPNTAKLTLLSIPRDTKVQVKGSSVPKINSAYPVGGQKFAVSTVSSLLGVNIKYCVYIDTSSFKKIIDILGGVDFNVPADMDYDDPLQNLHVHLKKGQQHMDGAKAEQFMRFRQPNRYTSEIKKFYDGSDLKRIDAQQSFIKEVISQKVNVYNITKLNSIMSVIFKNVETNIQMDDALKLARNIGRLKAEEVIMLRLPGTDSNEHSGWYFVHDKAKSAEIIKQYFDSKSGFDNNINSKEPVQKETKQNTTTTKKPSQQQAPKPAQPAGDAVKANPSNAETNTAGTGGPMP